MAVAVQSLNCDVSSFNFQVSWFRQCFNPNFFAYGQFHLYVAYFFIQLWSVVVGRLGDPISFAQAVISLRVISAVASILNAFVLLKVLSLFRSSFTSGESSSATPEVVPSLAYSILNTPYAIFLILVFSPYAIQFSHFGTTESLLMLFYSLIIYFSLRISSNRAIPTKDIVVLSLASGLAVATKVSSVVFLVFPFLVLLYLGITDSKLSVPKRIRRYTLYTAYFILLTAIVATVFSPHNLFNFQDFLSSMRYETAVGIGATQVFYTRTFDNAVPVLFQAMRVFPYALGWPQYALFIAGFLLLPWKDRKINFLRVAFLLYFIPSAFLFAKWTRFMAPILPIATVFSVLALISFSKYISSTRISNLLFKTKNWVLLIIIVVTIIPGLAYLSIYRSPDVRFTASRWIYENIPEGSYILSETANVVDIPLMLPNYKAPPANYTVISFDFYNLDTNPKLEEELEKHINRADYIFIPSRRVFSNHACLDPDELFLAPVDRIGYEASRCEELKKKYPLLNDYYRKLFLGELGFTKVAEFTSYPRMFGFEFPDESAEETWTVFDHPVVRVYKRIKINAVLMNYNPT